MAPKNKKKARAAGGGSQKGKPAPAKARSDVGSDPATPRDDDSVDDDNSEIEDEEVRAYVTSPDEGPSEQVTIVVEPPSAVEEDQDSAKKPKARPDALFVSATERTRAQEKDPYFQYKKSGRTARISQAARLQLVIDQERRRQDLAISPGAMDAKERSGEGLKKRINARNTALLIAMSEILDASTQPDNDKRDSMTIMSRQLQTQFNTQQIVRSCEDLLTLIRWMQERWLCGNLNTIGQSGVEAETEKDAQAIIELLKKLDGGSEVKTQTNAA